MASSTYHRKRAEALLDGYDDMLTQIDKRRQAASASLLPVKAEVDALHTAMATSSSLLLRAQVHATLALGGDS